MSEKIKLSIPDQIEDLKAKGITFEICSEKEAAKFLLNNTYYFKVKTYSKNYSNDNRERKYKNLDFAYLVELSKIDMYLRKYILEMCLDIEHVLKTRLISDCTANTATNGFDFVREYLDDHYEMVRSIISKAQTNSACSELASKYVDDTTGDLKEIPIWVIVELISFGDFVNLYTYYYQKYKRFPDYSAYLGAIKYLRNASAHSNCLLRSLKRQQGFKTTYNVMQSLKRAEKLISPRTREHKMEIPVVHDFVTLLLVYNDLLDTPYNRNMKEKMFNTIKEFFVDEAGRLHKNAHYFKDNKNLVEAYDFICNVLKFIDNESRKPNGKRLLKTN